ncbi:MAG: hypothetical protein K2O95_06270, partial [Clostridia bacterium]|nr:hypothetical protein [Clostridia bacterium]
MDIRKRKVKGIFVLSVLIILCLCTVSVLTCFTSSKSADAVIDLSSTTNIGELLLKNYETRNDNRVFDKDTLSKLYKQMTGEETYEKVVPLSSGTLNGDNFRSRNGGKDITITIGGLVWNVVYLSRNRQDEPIVTLWLANSNQLPSEYRTAQWNLYEDNVDGTYPANMYGTSMIRALTLNNGGTYYSNYNGGSPQSAVSSSSNPFAKFTMDGVVGSLTSFIDTPSNVGWQESEKSVDYNYYPYNFNNDAYSTISPGNIRDNIDYCNYSNYDVWKNDKVWLPSMTETGWESVQSANGIWHTTENQRGNYNGLDTAAAHSWLRSAQDPNYSYVQLLLSDGSMNGYEDGTAKDIFAVRPAFHLNLAKAEAKSSKALTDPSNQTKAYTGQPLGIEDKYSVDFINAVDIEYYKGSSKISQPTEVGTYTVKYIAKDGYYWSSNPSSSEITKSFEITTAVLTYPSIYKRATQQYDGGNPCEFTIIDYDKNTMDFSWSDTYSGVNFDGALAVVSATNVGKYEFKFTLKDTKNYAWVSTPKLEIEVEKAQLIVDRITVSGGNNTVISGTKSGGIKVDVYIDANGLPKGSDTVPIVITATHSVLGTFDVSGNIDIGVSDLKKTEISLDLSSLRSDEQYTLGVKSTNGNYDAVLTNRATLDILDPSVKTNITWDLYEDSDLQLAYRSYAELNENDV